MRARTGLALTAALMLSAPTAAQAATVNVQSLSGDFAATNSTVIKTPDGVHFGTYGDAGAIGGTLVFNGYNGRTLGSVPSFGYTFTYRERGSTTGAAPYMRIFLDADPAVDSDDDGIPNNDVDHDVILDPGENGANVPPQATDVTRSTTATTVRFDDDEGAGSQRTYASLLADPAIAGLTISSVNISQGFSTGQDVSGIVRSERLGTDTFAFNLPPDTQQGAAGGTTIIQQVPAPANGLPTGSTAAGTTRAATCKGDDLITLHATKRTRQLSLRATLRGKRLKVDGRAITVDLRNRGEGNYDVKIVQRFRSHGRVHTSTTHRVRSVACA
jgi:hypothetical protein